MPVLDQTQRSINAAIADGSLDASISAGPIAAVLKVAEAIDDPDFPYAGGRLDNVSLPTYLKYCDALGLTPAARKGQSASDAKGGKLAQLRSIEGGRAKKAK